jgi:hypothetical protein
MAQYTYSVFTGGWEKEPLDDNFADFSDRFFRSLPCSQCGTKGFGDVSITVKDEKKHTGYTMWICQSCGHKFVSAEVGSMGSIRFIKPEPPACNVKPKLLTDGGNND